MTPRLAAPPPVTVDQVVPDGIAVAVGPGTIAAGAWVACEDGALPAAYPNMTSAVVVSIGPRHTRIRIHGEHQVRTAPNTHLRLDRAAQLAAQWPGDPLDRPLPYGRYTNPRGYQWLPRYSWIGWTIAEHLAYARGERPLEDPPAASPARLVIVGCGGAKRRHVMDACNLYVGSYFAAARRAADALMSGPDPYQVIVSAKFGLLNLHDVVKPYDLRMGQPGSVGADTVKYQAQQLGLMETPEVIVLAGRRYAAVVSAVWPHTHRPLDGAGGIGRQLQRLAAIAATGRLFEPRDTWPRPSPADEAAA